MGFAACATPADSGRHGLFDDLSSGDSASSRRFAAERRFDREQSNYEPAARLVGEWNWPLKHVSVTSPYGDRGNSFHEGIDLQAPVGTPAYSAAPGQVIYSGSRVRGYGRVIVVKHLNGYMTVYAHLSRPLVRLGQTVRKGQKIALTGASGRVSGPHLHFEIRKGIEAFDPIRLIASNALPRAIPVVHTTRRMSARSARP
jgi:murein DD-endopeptidase MepM/ murein hydrolase activator NlpD